jgi:hypothetical protein
MSKKILYIGTWDHFEVTKHFDQTDEFVFIDTQPRSEFDCEIFDPEMYRTRFYDRIMKKSNKYGFDLKSIMNLDPSYSIKIKADPDIPFICPTILTFEKATASDRIKQTIRYYISTNILYNMCDILEEDIKTSDGLILSGYLPNKLVLKMLSSDITIYCYTQTVYSFDPAYDTENIIFDLQNMGKNYVVICNSSGAQLLKCSTIQQVEKFCSKI